MILIPQSFEDLCPHPVTEKGWKILELINKKAASGGLTTPHRKAMFLAHACVESAWFTRLEENLYYRAPRLIQVFRCYRTRPDLAYREARNPQAIANRAYAGKNGNGDRLSGDGWFYRGRGIYMITGKGNYRGVSLSVYGDDRLVQKPQLLMEPEGAVDSAFYFWKSRKMNDIIDIVRSTETINGGQHGLKERNELYHLFLRNVT